MHIIHTSAHVDPDNRRLEALLEAWPTLVDVAAAVQAPDTDVTVVIPAARDDRVERDGVHFLSIAARPGGRARRKLGHWTAPFQPRLEQAIAALRPDVVHFHSLSFPRHVGRLTRLLPRTPVLVQDHADHAPPPWLRTVYRRGLARAAAVLFTSAEQAHPFRAAGVLRADTPVLEVPESSSRFTPGDTRMARAETCLHGDPCLLWLGHLDDNKDPLCVLAALRIAAPSLPDPHLWMAWRHGPLLPRVQRRVSDDDVLRDRVHFLGPQPHGRIETLLRAADFLLQGSHAEGSGYAVIEALACGVTPIVTSLPSLRALTEGGTYGGLSPPGDARAMAASLEYWNACERTARRLRARAHFERALSFDVVGARLRDCCARFAASVPPAPHNAARVNPVGSA